MVGVGLRCVLDDLLASNGSGYCRGLYLCGSTVPLLRYVNNQDEAGPGIPEVGTMPGIVGDESR